MPWWGNIVALVLVGHMVVLGMLLLLIFEETDPPLDGPGDDV